MEAARAAVSLGVQVRGSGGGVGVRAAVTLTFPHRAAPWWLVWAAFAVLATTVAGVVFAYGLSLWGELHDVVGDDYKPRKREVALPVTAIVVGSLLVMYVTCSSQGQHTPARAARWSRPSRSQEPSLALA